MSQLAQIHRLAGALLLAATATACSTSTEPPVDFTADTGSPASTAAEPRVVAEVTSREGATVRFLDERAAGSDPIISIEIASPASTPVLDALLAQQPTALELYRAIAPGQAAPAELVREHQLIADHDASYAREPRLLTSEGVAQTNLTEDYACGTFAHWKAAFDAWAPPLDGQYAAAETATTSGYVGYAPKFYFDVCRTTTSNYAYVARTERRTNSAAAWSIYNDGSPLGGNQRYRFFRNTFACSSYQYRLYVVPAGGGGYYRGATWADEFGCSFEL